MEAIKSGKRLHYGSKENKKGCGKKIDIEKDVFSFDLNYCTCDDNKKLSDRKFYIGAYMTDVSNN